jgi:pyruvate/2-oxoglutarate dehydrogenase complex dihydrolipoamide dehydrogenase (E3) component
MAEADVAVEEYDAIIIGSGQGGTPLAIALEAAGRKTALVERIHVGGTCINEGCTPTKTMVASARTAYAVRHAAEYGVHTGPVTVSLRGVRQRKDDIVSSFRRSGERRLEGGGVDLIRGTASFTGPHTLAVRRDGQADLALTAPLIVINTGGRPAVPSVPGIEDVPYLNSTTIMDLQDIPEHLVVLGGSYVGLEFGQMFRRFGSEVTIVHLMPHLIEREDVDISDAVTDILQEEGIRILTGARTTRVERSEKGVRLRVETSGGEEIVEGSHLLVATGRVPNTESLNLLAAGITCDAHGFITVDDVLATTVPGVYAIGDVNGGPAFTHISYDDFRIVQDHLLGEDRRRRSDRLVPYVMFINPQLGRIGITERQAREQALNVNVARIPMDYVARAWEVGDTRGLMKAIVDAGSGEILGCAVLGIEGGEVMAMVEVAMLGKLPYTVLRDAIFAHPTLAESLNTLFSNFAEQS